MNMKEASVLLFNNTIRIEKIVWIGGCSEGFGDRDVYDDLVMDVCDDRARCHPSMSVFLEAPEHVWEGEEEFLYWATENDVLGFLVQVETPVPSFLAVSSESTLANTGNSYSWGHTHCTVMYVDDVLDAVDMAVQWKGDLYQKALNRVINALVA